MAKPFGRSLSDFCDQADPLKPAEALLRDCARTGQTADLRSLADRSVRAGFLRFLVLGGDDFAPVHEDGVTITGAEVADQFDLNESEAARSLICSGCIFEKGVFLYDASLKGLALIGGRVGPCPPQALTQNVASVAGSRLKCSSSIFLIGGVKLTHGLLFDSASIAGKLALDGADVRESGGRSIDLSGANIGGDLTMVADTRGEKKYGFKSTGEIRLNGTSVKGNLRIVGGSLKANGEALIAYGLTVGGGFYFQKLEDMSGARMTGAKVGVLIDDLASWQKGRGANKFDGFTYDRIADESPRSKDERQTWLDTQKPYVRKLNNPERTVTVFLEAPWQFAADSLEKLGLGEEARALRIETARRRIPGAPIAQQLYLWPYYIFARSGFSVQPLIGTSVAVLVAGWLAIGLGVTFGSFCAEGDLKDENGQSVHRLCPSNVGAGLENVRSRDFVVQDWMPSHDTAAPLIPALYSLENEVPIVKFSQAEHWRARFGSFAWAAVTFQSLFGTIVVTGLVALFGAKLFRQ
jgi:hypothetical protein